MTTAQPSRKEIKLKTASGGSCQKPLKSFGDLTFETQYCTGFAINLSANSPPVSCSTSEDPIQFEGSINFYTFTTSNPISFIDPFGKQQRDTPVDIYTKLIIISEVFFSKEKQIFESIAVKTKLTDCQLCISKCVTEKLIELCKQKIIEKALIWIAGITLPNAKKVLYERILDVITEIHIGKWTKECMVECKDVCCNKNK